MGVLLTRPSKGPKDYEKMLTELQERILRQQESINRLKLRTRTLSVHMVLLAVVVYGGLLVYHFVGRRQRALSWGLGLFVYPFAVYYLKQGIARTSVLLISRHQRVLAALQTLQSKQLEELKEATGYNRTKTILDKYAHKEETVSSASATATAARTAPTEAKKQLALRRRPKAQKDLVHPSEPPQRLIQNEMPLPLPPSSPTYQQPGWIDRLMDSLIGDDSRNQKFALICQNCLNHNGLLPPEFFPQARYQCPNCGFFNTNTKGTRDTPPRICEIEEETGKGSRAETEDERKCMDERKDDPENPTTQKMAE